MAHTADDGGSCRSATRRLDRVAVSRMNEGCWAVGRGPRRCIDPVRAPGRAPSAARAESDCGNLNRSRALGPSRSSRRHPRFELSPAETLPNHAGGRHRPAFPPPGRGFDINKRFPWRLPTVKSPMIESRGHSAHRAGRWPAIMGLDHFDEAGRGAARAIPSRSRCRNAGHAGVGHSGGRRNC